MNDLTRHNPANNPGLWSYHSHNVLHPVEVIMNREAIITILRNPKNWIVSNYKMGEVTVSDANLDEDKVADQIIALQPELKEMQDKLDQWQTGFEHFLLGNLELTQKIIAMHLEKASAKLKVLSDEEIEKVVSDWVNESFSVRSIQLDRGHWEYIAPVIAQSQLDSCNRQLKG